MALIKCSECGKEISDKATNCIHCGAPIDKKKIKMIIIHDNPEKGFFRGTKASLNSYVDNRFVGSTKDNEMIESEISVGKHIFKIELPQTATSAYSNPLTGGGVLISEPTIIQEKELDILDEYNEIKIKVSIKVGKTQGIISINEIEYN